MLDKPRVLSIFPNSFLIISCNTHKSTHVRSSIYYPFLSAYGLTEAGNIVMNTEKWNREFSVGKPLELVDMRVITLCIMSQCT